MAEVFDSRRILVYSDHQVVETEDPVVNEVPLTIMLNDSELATLLCSPYALEELVVGFLLSEGLVNGPDEVFSLQFRMEQGVAWVDTVNPVSRVDSFLRRNFASCCGKGRPALYFVNDRDQLKTVETDACFKAQHLLNLMAELDRQSENFHLTGGVHGAALADNNGIVVRYEDIGRHNALDRILGYVYLHSIYPTDKIVLLSGRIASEMLIKTVRMRVPVVVSRSAPTGLAVDLAEELSVTIVGFARGERMSIYSHPERIDF